MASPDRSRYAALGAYLAERAATGERRVVLPFATIEGAILRGPLPASARDPHHRWGWWHGGGHAHAWEGWLRAGWQVEAVDFAGETVTFGTGRRARAYYQDSGDASRIFGLVARSRWPGRFVCARGSSWQGSCIDGPLMAHTGRTAGVTWRRRKKSRRGCTRSSSGRASWPRRTRWPGSGRASARSSSSRGGSGGRSWRPSAARARGAGLRRQPQGLAAAQRPRPAVPGAGPGCLKPQPTPPYVPGDRVRCVVSTAVAMRGLELRGRFGTVRWATYYAAGAPSGWEVTVAWDRLQSPALAHHSPEELELVGR